MDKNGLLVVLLFLFMIGFGWSNALNSRKLVTTTDPNGSSNANQDSLLSSPPPDEKKQDPSPIGETKPKDTPTINPLDDESKGMNDANTKTSSENSSDKKQDKGKSHDGKEKVENQKQLQTFASKNCKGNPFCSDQEKTMIACIQDFENGTNKLTLLVQNERDKPLKVNITLGTSKNNHLPAFEIPSRGTEKVNFKFSGDKSTKVILNAGNGDCELQIDAPKNMAVDDASKSKNADNTSKPKDVDNPADSPVKPKDKDDPAKLKDVDDHAKSKEAENVDSPAKIKDADDNAAKKADDAAKAKDADDAADAADAAKAKDADDPAKAKDADDPAKAKEADDAAKAKEADDAAKAKDADDPAKAKEADDTAKAKDADDAAKAKDADDAAKGKAKDGDDAAKVKDVGPPPKSETVDTPPNTIGMETPISQSNLLDQLTFYSKQVTPIYGAYFAFLVALVIGGSWAMCSFRKRRTDGGVPYQELEMGLPESSNAIDVETAEGWDQDWDDDDWDEDKAIRSPGARTISSNGLTSRAVKKDGWDADWEN